MAEAHCALGDISTLIDLFRNYTKLFTIHTNSTKPCSETSGGQIQCIERRHHSPLLVHLE